MSPCRIRVVFALLTLLVLCLSDNALADIAAIAHTKAQLQQVAMDVKILETKLRQARHEHHIVEQQLANTEKEIGKRLYELQTLQQAMEKKQAHSATLHAEALHLTTELKNETDLIAMQLRAYYKHPTNQRLKSLYRQGNTETRTRLSRYYHYLLQAHWHLITRLHKTHEALIKTQRALATELHDQAELQSQIKQEQQTLLRAKETHLQLVNQLNHTIETHQKTLDVSLKNKTNLTHLLQSLAKNSLTETNAAFVWTRKKLPWPIDIKPNTVERMNQGIQCPATEGQPIIAVYPGKIVFSDWLKGYGLLLIIDHGRDFMTLYAHNQSLFKQKGDTVYQGEQIGLVGHSGGIKKSGLYFEIRHRGKAIPPLDWLSR